MKTKLITVILVILQIKVALGQMPLNVPQNAGLPNIIPASPTASAFARYGDIPVDISTGVPSIQIPLYTITSRTLSIPLTLSYHASGIKLSDVSTPVGLGWVLGGMGVVSRTVLDRPDDVPVVNEPIKAKYTTADSYFQALSQAHTRSQQMQLGLEFYTDMTKRDKESDRYSYSLPGGDGGTFRYDYNTDQCIIVPYKPHIIQKGMEQYSSTPGINAFSITDEKGNQYVFDKAYATTSGNGTFDASNTSWYLAKITNSNGTDEITYQYNNTNTNNFTAVSYSHATKFGSAKTDYVLGVCDAFYDQSAVSNYQTLSVVKTQEPLLESITSATTVVKFEYTADRQDQQPDAKYRLSSIKVYDKISNGLIKEITLDNNAYFGGRGYWAGGTFNNSNNNNRRLKLQGVNFKGKDGTADQKYAISYEDGDIPPYNNVSGTRSFAEDYWGYYNGMDNNGLIPLEYLPYNSGITTNPYFGNSLYAGSRRPDHGAAKACLIKEIQYPSGGKTLFEFEGNYGKSCYFNHLNYEDGAVGGFRIKKIRTIDGTNSANDIIKTYEYNNSSSKKVDVNLFQYMQQYLCYWPVIDCGPNYYSRTALIMPTFYFAQSSSFSPLSFSNGSPVLYTNVTEYAGTQVQNTGKTEYNYSTPNDPQPETWDRNYTSFWYDNGSYTPLLLNKKVYKKYNTGYIPVSELNNSYNMVRDNQFSTGFSLVKTLTEAVNGSDRETAYNLDFIPGTDATTMTDAFGNTYTGYIHYFNYTEHKASEAVSLLTQTIEKNYNPDGQTGVTSITQYKYDNWVHLQPTEIKTTTSQGETITTQLTYPANYYGTSPYGGTYDDMMARNVVTPVIEQKIYKNDKFIQSTKTNYKYWGLFSGSHYIIAPSSIEKKTFDSNTPPSTEVAFDQYDNKGNTLQLTTHDGIATTYLYGYNYTYPVAKVIGTGINNVLQKIDPATLQTPVNDADLRNKLASLRTIPNTLTSTYTYAPLVGMTSETDPGGKTIYYEYDNSNKLALIRDNDLNILKNIKYNYYYNADNLYNGFPNTTQSRTFTKSGCPVGTIGESVNYAVPYGKYVSPISVADANQKAQNDLNANGQAFADNNGRCINIWYNAKQERSFNRNDCTGGVVGSTVTYSVAANKYSSFISQEDADLQALNEVTNQGQAYANTAGTCPVPWYNNSQYRSFVKENCGTGQFPVGAVTYTVPAGKYTSSVNQADADQKAINEINTNGQTYANANGTCKYDIRIISMSPISGIKITIRKGGAGGTEYGPYEIYNQESYLFGLEPNDEIKFEVPQFSHGPFANFKWIYKKVGTEVSSNYYTQADPGLYVRAVGFDISGDYDTIELNGNFN